MRLADIRQRVAGGESDTLELKRSTGQLTRAVETLCGFLNGKGGMVIFGVTPQGAIVGQQVADKTLRDIASNLRRFEPSAPIATTRVSLLESEKELIVMEVMPQEALPAASAEPHARP